MALYRSYNINFIAIYLNNENFILKAVIKLSNLKIAFSSHDVCIMYAVHNVEFRGKTTDCLSVCPSHVSIVLKWVYTLGHFMFP